MFKQGDTVTVRSLNECRKTQLHSSFVESMSDCCLKTYTVQKVFEVPNNRFAYVLSTPVRWLWSENLLMGPIENRQYLLEF